MRVCAFCSEALLKGVQILSANRLDIFGNDYEVEMFEMLYILELQTA